MHINLSAELKLALTVAAQRNGDGARQLLLAKRPAGYISRYHHVRDLDTVFVLAIESRRRN